jgi:hypothetical protein
LGLAHVLSYTGPPLLPLLPVCHCCCRGLLLLLVLLLLLLCCLVATITATVCRCVFCC